MSVAHGAEMIPTTVAMAPGARVLIAHPRLAGPVRLVVTVLRLVVMAIAGKAATRSAKVTVEKAGISVVTAERLVVMEIAAKAVTNAAMVQRLVVTVTVARAATRNVTEIVAKAGTSVVMTTVVRTAAARAGAVGSRSAAVSDVNGPIARPMTVRVTTIPPFLKMSPAVTSRVLRATS
jgi:hypothetical protein